MARPTLAKINLSAIGENLALIKSRLQDKVEIIPVVKADAYGHGAVQVSKILDTLGIEKLAVACIEEAIELKETGVKASVIILGPLRKEEIKEIAERGLMPVLSCFEDLENIKSAKTDRPLKAILKVDTGMGRMGFLPEDVSKALQTIKGIPSIELSGLFSHFSVSESADEDDVEFTGRQVQDFTLVKGMLKKSGITDIKASIANSGGVMMKPEAGLGAVRPGIMIYGVRPSFDLPFQGLKPVMTWATKISQIRSLPEGTCVSYGRCTTLQRSSKIAVLPVGYADGLNRRIEPGFNFYVKGEKAPITGVITMDLTMVDVTDIPAAKVGDEVLIMGEAVQELEEGGEKIKVAITAEEHAKAAGTIPYEILTSVGKRVKRIYLEEE